ncbi:alpha/beta hydrolase [Alsobacter sp. KACC 23698]|uniref:Alpha/beta hydrolase n=1 Tax=Alsobacter sp. KACC 23698 TaxID=3149229 RepID=A0AAU7JNH4_9HYPH
MNARMFSTQTLSLFQRTRRELTQTKRSASAWSATSVLVSLPSDPTPKGVESGVLRMGDGIQVRFASWRPAGTARGTVWIIQGRADFIEKYYETVRDLLARGFAVATFDWRGQGGSERLVADPRLNHAESFEPYVADLQDIVAKRWFAGLPRPFHALAHSMGANVLLQTLARNAGLFESAVLTAPMIALAPSLRPNVARIFAAAFAAVGLGQASIPGGQRNGEVAAPFTRDNLLTSCPVRYGRAADIVAHAPHLTVGRPTIGWVQAALKAMDALREGSAIATPVLIAAGDRDRVTSTAAALAHGAALPNARTVTLADCAHEVLLETDAVRARFWAAFDAFLT